MRPKVKKRHPENKKSHLSLQNFSITAPSAIAIVMQRIKPAQPPIMIPMMPYYAAKLIAEI